MKFLLSKNLTSLFTVKLWTMRAAARSHISFKNSFYHQTGLQNTKFNTKIPPWSRLSGCGWTWRSGLTVRWLAHTALLLGVCRGGDSQLVYFEFCLSNVFCILSLGSHLVCFCLFVCIFFFQSDAQTQALCAFASLCCILPESFCLW